MMQDYGGEDGMLTRDTDLYQARQGRWGMVENSQGWMEEIT